jgi:AcrR family transcriptional regulator
MLSACPRRPRRAAAGTGPAKPPLSRDAIVRAALEIAAAEGMEALSMRRVAQALDTGRASLYVYVSDRDELYDLLFDAAIGTIETEPTDPRALARAAPGACPPYGHDDVR